VAAMLALRAFIAGFVSTLVFHQGLLAILHAAGASPRAAFNMEAVPPLGIPQVVSLAFWGGIWAIAMAYALKDFGGASAYWIWWTVIGALAPSIVALFIVFPLKGMPMAGGWDPKIIVGALLLNGAWGFGSALILRYMPQFG
jgi:hypothetical protein